MSDRRTGWRAGGLRSFAVLVSAGALIAAAGWGVTAATVGETERPYGTFDVTLDLADVEGTHVPATRWTLDLRPGGWLLRNRGSPRRTHGALRLVGKELVFAGPKASFCRNADERYRWQLRGRVLRLNLIGRTSCWGKDLSVVLTSRPWRKGR